MNNEPRSPAGSGGFNRRLFLASGLAAAGLSLDATRAEADFPKLSGRAATLLIGSDLGGGYDLVGRLLARHLERAVPGLRLNVQNVGKAGGKLCAKMIQEGPGDGSVIAFPPVSLLSAQFLDEEGIAYDIGTWRWIGKMASEARVLMKGPAAKFAGIVDLRGAGDPATLSVRSTSSFAYYEALWVNAMLGTRIKPVPGYKSGEKEAAMLSGEVMMTTGNYPDDRKTLEAPGVEVILRINDTVIPAPFDKAPTLSALRGGDQRYDLVAGFLDANYELGRWVAAPPSIAADVLAEWRAAFDATAVNPDFIEEARRLDIELTPMAGAELERRIAEILADQDKLRRELTAAFACGKALAEGSGAACQQARGATPSGTRRRRRPARCRAAPTAAGRRSRARPGR